MLAFWRGEWIAIGALTRASCAVGAATCFRECAARKRGDADVVALVPMSQLFCRERRRRAIGLDASSRPGAAGVRSEAPAVVEATTTVSAVVSATRGAVRPDSRSHHPIIGDWYRGRWRAIVTRRRGGGPRRDETAMASDARQQDRPVVAAVR